ncbi:IS1/IS1595 family N-terminal zinc-binding domain-containing protein [Budvicia aquatica]
MFKLHTKQPSCPHCDKNTHVRKHGTSRCGFQRYLCSDCRRTFQGKYIYLAYREARAIAQA